MKVSKPMGILNKLDEKRTGEMRFDLVNQQSGSWSLSEIGGISPTGTLELVRDDLTEGLYESANVTF